MPLFYILFNNLEKQKQKFINREMATNLSSVDPFQLLLAKKPEVASQLIDLRKVLIPMIFIKATVPLVAIDEVQRIIAEQNIGLIYLSVSASRLAGFFDLVLVTQDQKLMFNELKKVLKQVEIVMGIQVLNKQRDLVLEQLGLQDNPVILEAKIDRTQFSLFEIAEPRKIYGTFMDDYLQSFNPSAFQ